MSSFKALLSSLRRSDYAIAFVVALIWQVLFTWVGWVMGGGALLDHTIRWDSGWYLTVMQDHYATSAPSAAFYPLFPLLVSAFTALSFGIVGPALAGFIINTAALWLAIVALVKLSGYFSIPHKFRYLPAALLFLAPAAFFMHLFYTEALFLAIGAWAYLFALQRKWWYMGLLLAALTASRLPSILFIALCGLEYFRSQNWSIRRSLQSKAIWAFALAPIGFISYGLYLLHTTGSFFAMFSAYHASDDWTYQVFNPNIFETLARATYQPLRALLALRPFDHDLLVNHLVPLFTLALLAATSLYGLLRLRKQFIPLGIFGLLSIVMFSLNSNVVSAHRYTLPCIVIYIVGAHIFIHQRRLRPIIVATACLSLAFQVLLYALVIHGNFVG